MSSQEERVEGDNTAACTTAITYTFSCKFANNLSVFKATTTSANTS